MDYIYNKLPKDLAYIIDDYAKNRAQYDEVIEELDLTSACFWQDNNFFNLKYHFFKNGNYKKIVIKNIKIVSDEEYPDFY